MKEKSKNPKPAPKVAPKATSPTQRTYGPQQGQNTFGGPGKPQKSAAHRLGKSRKVH